MSQMYLNGPSVGRAMSAEEFAAGVCQHSSPQPCPSPVNGGCCCYPPSAVQPTPPANGCCCYPPAAVQPAPPMDCGCGCGGTGSDCPADDCPDDDCGQTCQCCQQMICCCHTVSVPTPQPPQVEEGCCCKQSFQTALSLLCDQQISSLLDFDTSAFLTNTYVAGATLEAAAADTPADNLSDALTGSFRRFAPGSCDLLDVDAPVNNAAGTEVFTATQVSLCQLDAVVIQGAAAAAEGDLSAEEVAARNFRCLRQRLAQRLSPCNTCGQGQCFCGCCDGQDCCCAAGLLNTLAQNNISRRVSLVAGLLVLTGVTLLGAVGNVLVLSNDTDRRLYFVCVNSVQFVG